MTTARPDTEDLLCQASHGDAGARADLLARHRARLRRMIAYRLDRRLAARVDPSDVVQEAQLEVARRTDWGHDSRQDPGQLLPGILARLCVQRLRQPADPEDRAGRQRVEKGAAISHDDLRAPADRDSAWRC